MASPETRGSSAYSTGVNPGNTEMAQPEVPRKIPATPDRGRQPLPHGSIPVTDTRPGASLSPRVAEPSSRTIPVTPGRTAPRRNVGEPRIPTSETSASSGNGVTEAQRVQDSDITATRTPVGKDKGTPGRHKTGRRNGTVGEGQIRSAAADSTSTHAVTEATDSGELANSSNDAKASSEPGRSVGSGSREAPPARTVSLTKDTAGVAGSQDTGSTKVRVTDRGGAMTVVVPPRTEGQVKTRVRPLTERTLKIGTLGGHRWYESVIKPSANGASPKRRAEKAVQPVEIPDAVATNGALQEMLPEMRTYVKAFWDFQTDRIKKDGGIPFVSNQEVFDQEALRFCEIVDKVEGVINERPGRPVMVLMDVDEMFARVAETNSTPQIPGLTDVPTDGLSEDKKRLLDKVLDKDSYEKLQLSPGAILAVNYLKLHHGDTIQFRTLSTKSQVGQDMYLKPMLEAVCPGAFESMMSCRDGAAEELVPDVLARLRKAKTAGQTLSLKDVVPNFIYTSPEERTVLLDLVIDTNDGQLTDYDIKLLMMIRLLDQSRRKGAQDLKKGPPNGKLGHRREDSEQWYDELKPEIAVVMFEDVYQDAITQAALGNVQDGEKAINRAGKIAARDDDSSLRYFQMSRYKLPDDLF